MKPEDNALPFLSYEDEMSLIEMTDDPQKVSGKEAPSEEVIEYIAGRVPPESVYEKLVFLLNPNRGQITFNVINKSETHFLRKTTGEYDIRYFDTCDMTGTLPVFNIHVTKAYFDTELKDNIKTQAMLLLEFFAEKVLVSPINGTRRQFALKKAKALCDPSKRGLYLDGRRQKRLDSAVKEENLKYLFGLIKKYDIRKDPDRIYLQAIYEAIGKLKTINISTGTDLLAWYRYMLESRIRKIQGWLVNKIILRISNIINESVKEEGVKLNATRIRIKKTLINKPGVIVRPKDLSKYNQRFVFPYKQDDYHKGSIILMPECHIKLSKDFYNSVQLNTDQDKNSLDSFRRDIKIQALNEGVLSDIEEGLKNNDGVMVVLRIIAAAKKILKRRRAKGDKRGVVIGILAPASAGKTTLTRMLTLGSREEGLKACYLGCDSLDFLHPDKGFRYDIGEDGYRNTHIWGPGIYDAAKIRRALDHLKQGKGLTKPADKHGKTEEEQIDPGQEIIVSDGVFIGVDKEVRDVIDILVCLYPDRETEKTRLDEKWNRDMAKKSTHTEIDLLLDFAEKQFHETKDGMATLIPERADFVWVRKQRELYIRKGSVVSGVI